MSKRTGFTGDDLGVLKTVIDERITKEKDTEEIEMLAPLFRIRDKVIALQDRTKNAVPTTIRRRKSTGPRAVATEQ